MSKATCVMSSDYLLWVKCATSAECKPFRKAAASVMVMPGDFTQGVEFSKENVVGLS